jgi:hypothetical protein
MKSSPPPLLLAFASLLLLVTVRPMCASYARYSDTDLIAASAVIVEADYAGRAAAPVAPHSPPVWFGVLRVRATLKGTVAEGIVLFRVPAPAAPVSSSDLTFRAGQTGLWFLRAAPDGALLIDHPQRFLPANDPHAGAFRQLLRAGK